MEKEAITTSQEGATVKQEKSRGRMKSEKRESDGWCNVIVAAECDFTDSLSLDRICELVQKEHQAGQKFKERGRPLVEEIRSDTRLMKERVWCTVSIIVGWVASFPLPILSASQSCTWGTAWCWRGWYWRNNSQGRKQGKKHGQENDAADKNSVVLRRRRRRTRRRGGGWSNFGREELSKKLRSSDCLCARVGVDNRVKLSNKQWDIVAESKIHEILILDMLHSQFPIVDGFLDISKVLKHAALKEQWEKWFFLVTSVATAMITSGSELHFIKWSHASMTVAEESADLMWCKQ